MVKAALTTVSAHRWDALGLVGIVILGLLAWGRLDYEHEQARAGALATYRERAHRNASEVAHRVEASVRQIYQGLRTIARLPAVRAIDHDARIGDDARTSIQELYNNLAENVSVSEFYIVPAKFDPDAVDPLTGERQKPIATFDELIVGRTAEEDPTGRARTEPAKQAQVEEIEIFEYREMRRQIGELRGRYPDMASVRQLDYPARISDRLLTCDNTHFLPSAPDDEDRTGLVYSVPIYSTDGAFRGIVSAVILASVLGDMLPGADMALVSPVTGVIAGSSAGSSWQRYREAMTQGEVATGLPYSEFVPVALPGVAQQWRLWTAPAPDAFFASSALKALEATHVTRQTALVAVLLLLGAGFLALARRQQAVAARNALLSAEVAERTAALHEATTAAQAANAAKSEFLARMSHDMRTPTHAILGAADLIVAGTRDRSLLSKVAIIQEASRSLIDLVGGLLELAAIEQGRLTLVDQPVAPDMVLHDVCGMLRPLADQKGLELSGRVGAGVPDVIVSDGPRLRQILVNLVGNAIKYTDTGAVTVRLDRGTDDSGAPVMDFTVEDTGRGIAPDLVRDLFEPFKVGSTAAESTGLGLAISRSLANALGGDLTYEPGPDGGSTFRLRLPLRAEVAAAAVEPRPAGSSAACDVSGARVLLVDDHERILQLTREMLEQAGCIVTTAASGGAGLARFDDAAPFDIVLLDCRMPDMSGLDVARRMRAIERSRAAAPVPIIALTANAFASEREECMAAGMTDLLSKPFQTASLLTNIARHIGRA